MYIKEKIRRKTIMKRNKNDVIIAVVREREVRLKVLNI